MRCMQLLHFHWANYFLPINQLFLPMTGKHASEHANDSTPENSKSTWLLRPKCLGFGILGKTVGPQDIEHHDWLQSFLTFDVRTTHNWFCSALSHAPPQVRNMPTCWTWIKMIASIEIELDDLRWLLSARLSMPVVLHRNGKKVRCSSQNSPTRTKEKGRQRWKTSREEGFGIVNIFLVLFNIVMIAHNIHFCWIAALVCHSVFRTWSHTTLPWLLMGMLNNGNMLFNSWTKSRQLVCQVSWHLVLAWSFSLTSSSRFRFAWYLFQVTLFYLHLLFLRAKFIGNLRCTCWLECRTLFQGERISGKMIIGKWLWRMQDTRLQANLFTYNAILGACEQSGQWRLAIYLLKAVNLVFKIIPKSMAT